MDNLSNNNKKIQKLKTEIIKLKVFLDFLNKRSKKRMGK